MKTKEERRKEVMKEYYKIIDSACEKYDKKIKEIDEE